MTDRCKCGAVALDPFIGTYSTPKATHTRERCKRDANAPKPCTRCNGSGIEADWLNIGAGMRARREKLGIGLNSLARQLGLTPAYLSDMERGRRAWRGPKALKVAKFLDRMARADVREKE